MYFDTLLVNTQVNILEYSPDSDLRKVLSKLGQPGCKCWLNLCLGNRKQFYCRAERLVAKRRNR